MTPFQRIETAAIEETLPAILLRIVSELHDVAYLIERIEPQLLDISDANILASPEAMKVVQGIDLAVQKTRGIAEFIDTIAGTMPEGWTVDLATALSLVKLTEMQKALSGGGGYHTHSQPMAQPMAKAAGDFDFF
ncbi:chemotaxis protein CheT [Rhizobium sp. LEGMi135b]